MTRAADADRSVHGAVPSLDVSAFRAPMGPEELAELQLVTAAANSLDLRPREVRWRSLTYCILDAVWSIGARYDTVVVPVVRRVAREHDPDGDPLFRVGDPLPQDPAPLPAFLARFGGRTPLKDYTNTQRTSTRRGALKADVALSHARVFLDHGVRSLHDIAPLRRDTPRFEHLDCTLRRLPGEGQHGVGRAYLWMLVGDDQRVKPDRMVLRWLQRLGVDIDARSGATLLQLAARELSGERIVTPWELDHAIWLDERSRIRRTGSTHTQAI